MGYWKCLLGRRAVRNLVDRHLVVSGRAAAVVGVAGSSIGDPAGVVGRNQYCPFLSIGDPAGVLGRNQYCPFLSIGDPARVLGRNQYRPFLSIRDPAGVLGRNQYCAFLSIGDPRWGPGKEPILRVSIDR